MSGLFLAKEKSPAIDNKVKQLAPFIRVRILEGIRLATFICDNVEIEQSNDDNIGKLPLLHIQAFIPILDALEISATSIFSRLGANRNSSAFFTFLSKASKLFLKFSFKIKKGVVFIQSRQKPK